MTMAYGMLPDDPGYVRSGAAQRVLQPAAAQPATQDTESGAVRFEVPMDLFPTTKSSSTSSSNQKSNSGINWSNPLAAAMQPLLMTSGQNIQGVADNMAQTLQGQYSNMMRNAMAPNQFQGVLNQLAQRGMMNSTVGADALALAQNQAAQQIADQGYNAMLAQQASQFKVPEVQGNIAKLAEQSQSSGGSSGASSSLAQNPLAPYELNAQFPLKHMV